jgi:hypothetical protein
MPLGPLFGSVERLERIEVDQSCWLKSVSLLELGRSPVLLLGWPLHLVRVVDCWGAWPRREGCWRRTAWDFILACNFDLNRSVARGTPLKGRALRALEAAGVKCFCFLTLMNTDARSAELAPEPVLRGGSTRGNGHRSALCGTPRNAQCPASRSKDMKQKPQELPACLAACGWRGFTPAL